MCLVRLLMFRHAILKPRLFGTTLYHRMLIFWSIIVRRRQLQLVKWFTKLLVKIAIPFLLRCSLRSLTHDKSVFWCWTRPQPFWLQNDLMTLLHSVTFLPRDSSSKRCVNAEIVTLVTKSKEQVSLGRPAFRLQYAERNLLHHWYLRVE